MHVLLLMPVKVKRIDELQMLLLHYADADDDIADVKKHRKNCECCPVSLLFVR